MPSPTSKSPSDNAAAGNCTADEGRYGDHDSTIHNSCSGPERGADGVLGGGHGGPERVHPRESPPASSGSRV